MCAWRLVTVQWGHYRGSGAQVIRFLAWRWAWWRTHQVVLLLMLCRTAAGRHPRPRVADGADQTRHVVMTGNLRTDSGTACSVCRLFVVPGLDCRVTWCRLSQRGALRGVDGQIRIVRMAPAHLYQIRRELERAFCTCQRQVRMAARSAARGWVVG